MKQQCENCRFWREGGGVLNSGICFRYPPTIVRIGGMAQVMTVRPIVAKEDWCGEFQPTVVQTGDDDDG